MAHGPLVAHPSYTGVLPLDTSKSNEKQNKSFQCRFSNVKIKDGC